MALAPPPHPFSKLRVLKQAAREYMASGNAVTLTINAIANQAASAPLTVAGAALVDPATPKPFLVHVRLIQGGLTVAEQRVPTNATTGAWTTLPFAGGTLAAGTATATATVSYAPVVTSNTVTLT
jgi:beta-glucosidase-like glycosyl hydrolase